jgi:hypothetical protein
MGLTLSFTVSPSSPYHTLQFHLNRAVKKKLHDPGIAREAWIPILLELAQVLKILVHIPSNYSICVLPSKIYAGIILQHLAQGGNMIYPGHPSISYPSFTGLRDSGLNEMIMFPGVWDHVKPNLKGGFILCRDTDLVSGSSLTIQDLLSIREDEPDIHLCMDISISFANHQYTYEKVDSYLFDSEFVFGMYPGITVFVMKDHFSHSMQEKWADEFYFPEIKSGQVHPDILCHREVDVLKLYAFKEMCNDLVRRDPKIIRNEIIYKSILLTNALEGSGSFELMVKNETNRSSNIITARTLGSIDFIRDRFSHFGIQMDEFFQEKYGHIVRFANFPVHSKEQVEYLSDCITSL